MDKHMINIADPNVLRTMQQAGKDFNKSGIPTRYYPAVKTKHIEKEKTVK